MKWEGKTNNFLGSTVHGRCSGENHCCSSCWPESSVASCCSTQNWHCRANTLRRGAIFCTTLLQRWSDQCSTPRSSLLMFLTLFSLIFYVQYFKPPQLSDQGSFHDFQLISKVETCNSASSEQINIFYYQIQFYTILDTYYTTPWTKKRLTYIR